MALELVVPESTAMMCDAMVSPNSFRDHLFQRSNLTSPQNTRKEMGQASEPEINEFPLNRFILGEDKPNELSCQN